MLSDSMFRHSWLAFGASMLIIGIGFWLDRRNALQEE